MHMVCIFIYVSIYLCSYPSTNCISGLAAGSTSGSNLRCAWRGQSSELRATLQGRDQASSVIHFARCDRASMVINLDSEIEWIERCTWMPWSCKLRNVLGGCDQVSFETHLQSVIEQVEKSTWRPCYSEFQDEVRDHNRVRMVMDSEPANEWNERCTWWP